MPCPVTGFFQKIAPKKSGPVSPRIRELFVDDFMAAMEPILYNLDFVRTDPHLHWAMSAHDNGVTIELQNEKGDAMAVALGEIPFVARLQLEIRETGALLTNYLTYGDDFWFDIPVNGRIGRSLEGAISQCQQCMAQLSEATYTGTFQGVEYQPTVLKFAHG